MNDIRLSILLLLIMPLAGFSQNIEFGDTLDAKIFNAAREIMDEAETCALVTLDNEGRPRVRTMDPFIPEDDLVIWMGTNPKSRKVRQVKRDPRVTLYFLDNDATGYVMLHGKAELVDDPELKKKFWKKEWNAFYPDKDKGYLLIKVVPEWIEVLSPKRGINNDPNTWQPPVLMFNFKD